MRYQWLHRPIITVLLAFDILYNARLIRLLEPLPLQALILGSVTLVICFYLFIAFLRFYYLWVLLELLIIFIIIHQMLVFEARTSVPPDFNAFFQYIWVLSLVIFVVAANDGSTEFIVRRLLLFSTLYSALYVMLALAFQLGVLPQSIVGGIVALDDERGARLFSYSIAINFAWFAWLVRFSMKPGLKAFMGMLVTFVASALAVSRVSLLFTFIITVLYIAGVGARSIKWIALAMFCAVTLPSLYGLFDPGWSPYSYLVSDSSGAYRLFEYNVARVFIWDDPISAFGIAPGFQDAASLLLKMPVFGGDLGAIGVWFEYGLLGFVLFIASAFFACQLQAGLPVHLRQPLFLTGCFLTAYACLSPLSINGGSVFFGVVIANLVGQTRRRPQWTTDRYAEETELPLTQIRH